MEPSARAVPVERIRLDEPHVAARARCTSMKRLLLLGRAGKREFDADRARGESGGGGAAAVVVILCFTAKVK